MSDHIPALLAPIFRHKLAFELDAMNTVLGHGLTSVRSTSRGQSSRIVLSTYRGALHAHKRLQELTSFHTND